MNFGEHAMNPRNFGRLNEPSAIGRASIESEPLSIEIRIKLDNGKIVATSFDSFFCGFMFGICSMLTEHIKGLSLGEAESVSAEQLLATCPDLSETKRDYAQAAINALRAALNQAKENATH